MATVVNFGEWVVASANRIWTPDELAASQDAVGLLEKAGEQARRIIAEAESEAATIREKAQSEGFRAGEVQALRRVLGRLGGQETLTRAVRAFVTDAAATCAVSLLGGDSDPVRYRRLLETVERTLAGWTWLSLRVSPDCLEDAAAVVASIQGAITERVTLLGDEALKPGECVIESDAGWLDGRLETQIVQIRAALDEMLNPGGRDPSEP